MEELYLDTSVILCSFHPTEIYKEKAINLVDNDYLISPIVHDEIRNIKKRRFLIYKSVINMFDILKNNHQKKLTLKDMYNRCFKYNYGKNHHDIDHLNSLYYHILRELELRENMLLNEKVLEEFGIKLLEVFNNIQFGFLKILNFLENPLNYERWVLKENIGKKFNILHRHFKKISKYSQNKNDIKILIHGVEYSCYTNTPLDIVSNDKYMVQIKKDVKKHSLRVFKRLWFDIYSLRSYNLN